MNPHGGQDFLGFVIVLGIGGLCLLATSLATRDWFRRQDDELQRIIDEALDRQETDHAECENDDCDLVLCYCTDAHPVTDAACPGTVEPGCSHNTMVCEDHRISSCRECLIDARDDAGVRW